MVQTTERLLSKHLIQAIVQKIMYQKVNLVFFRKMKGLSVPQWTEEMLMALKILRKHLHYLFW